MFLKCTQILLLITICLSMMIHTSGEHRLLGKCHFFDSTVARQFSYLKIVNRIHYRTSGVFPYIIWRCILESLALISKSEILSILQSTLQIADMPYWGVRRVSSGPRVFALSIVMPANWKLNL